MCAQALHDSDQGNQGKKQDRRGLISSEFLHILTVLSVVPAYLIGGALIGYLLDRLFGTFPFIMAAGLLAALVFAVRDLLRLRDEFQGGHDDDATP